MLSAKRGGRQVLNVVDGEEAMAAVPADGDRVAIIGENKKLLIFRLDEIPEMQRGKGVKLFGGKKGRIADLTVFAASDGLARIDSAGRRHEIENWKLFEAKRAQAGRLAPKGFSAAKSFGTR